MPSLPPLSLYVHMPWCVRKCPYCDFNSHAAPEHIPQNEYVDALLQDLHSEVVAAAGRQLGSIFFGGGTPSLFAPEQIERFLNGVRAALALADDVEITLEANPGTIEHGRFAAYRQAGINRVSLGAQSFDEQQLQALGRIHGRSDIGRAVEELSSAGLHNFNLDLMYGLPGQTLSQARADVEAAIALRPAHISHYQLTLEPGTVFYHRPPPLPEADEIWRMQVESQALLAASGYGQYEVSAYAQPGRRSRHNLNYWQFGDYIGVGAGAHGKLTSVDDLGRIAITRTARVRQPREYLLRTGNARVIERKLVAAAEVPFEFMLNALRLLDGFDESTFEARTGLAFTQLAEPVRIAAGKGLLESPGERRWRPTELGQRFLNDLQEIFLPALAASATARRPSDVAVSDSRASG